MNRLRVAPIVEGYGEVAALPILLKRIWYEMLDGEYLDVIRPPIRQPRDKLARNKNDVLAKAIGLAAIKLSMTPNPNDDPELILVLIDADDDLPCELGPEMLTMAQEAHRDKRIACVTANIEFET